MSSIEEARDRINEVAATIQTLRTEMEEHEALIVAILRPFIPDDPDREPLSDTLVTPGSWSCTDDRNPAGTCVYDDENDDCHDTCLFCGHPEERK